MRAYADALSGVKAQANNVGVGRTVAGTVNALVAAYLDPQSSSPFKTGAAETQRSAVISLKTFVRRTARSRCTAPTIVAAGPCC